MASGGSRQTRDAALRKLLLAKRWVLAVSLALTGALAGLAASAFPGKTIKTPASGAGSEQGPSESSSSSGSSEGSSNSLAPPEQAPQSAEQESPSSEQGASQPATEAPPVVSGGS